MQSGSLQAATLAVVRERDLARVLDRIVGVLTQAPDVALARVWLVGDGDLCATCSMRAGCPDRSRCLHLVATAGRSRESGASWQRLDGQFRRLPLGVGKVGRVGASGAGMLLHDMSERSTWIARPDWAAREGIRSFAAQPLLAGDDVLGVVAVFARARIAPEAFAWLRAFADHAAVAIAHARASEALERDRTRLDVENVLFRERAARDAEPILGESPALAKVVAQADVAAGTDAPVLVHGEPGTGPVGVARRIHAQGRRAGAPFLTLDCAAVAGQRLEGVLVGRAGDRVGLLEAAAGGTLFLDEVGDLPRTLQATLVDVLRDGAFRPAGTGAPRRADVRVIAATSRSLADDVAAGRFDEELYCRLSVCEIVVPPLRERPADVAPLAEHFLQRTCARLRRPPMRLGARDRARLERYPWPGNVRELASVVERAVLLARDGELRLDLHLPPHRPGAPADDVIPASDWRRHERANLEAALRRAGGRIYGPGGAAELLGVPPTTLASRVKALGAARPPRDASPRTPPRGSAAP